MKHLALILFLTLLAGCSSFKDITNPISDRAPPERSGARVSEGTKTTLYFFRPQSLLTLGQRVEIHIDGRETAILGHNDEVQLSSLTGGHIIDTKVGLSLAIPITGLGGACKFSERYIFSQKKHFFKIKFSPGLICGEHEVIEVSEEDYRRLMQS